MRTNPYKDVHSNQQLCLQCNKPWKVQMFPSLIASLDKKNHLNCTITTKVCKVKNSLLELVEKLIIQNVLLLPILKNKKLLQALLMLSRLMKPYTECTREDNKRKKRINFWVEEKNQLKWEILDFLKTIRLHKTLAEQFIISNMKWKNNKMKTVQLWS